MKDKGPKKPGYNPNALEESELEMGRRKHQRDMEFVRLMEQVVDSTPVEKQRKREIADVLQEIFMLAKTEEGVGMVEQNIASSIPNISDEQLKYLNKEYEKKALAIKREKVDKKLALTAEEKIVLKTYQAINMEFKNRNLHIKEASNAQNKAVALERQVKEVSLTKKEEKKKKKASSKR